MTVETGFSIEDAIQRLLPYFKRKAYQNAEATLSTQNELYLEAKKSMQFSEEGETWATCPQVLKDFETLLQQHHTSSFDSFVHLLFPMICQILDDYRAENRLVGVKLVEYFLQGTSPDLIRRFRIQNVLYESFKTSITFDDVNLIEQSLILWIHLIGLIEAFGSTEFLSQCDQLLLLCCREIELPRNPEYQAVFVSSLAALVELMSFTSIRYVRKLVTSLCEAKKEANISDDVISSIIRNCWPRLDSQLKTVIIEHFPSHRDLLNKF